MEITYNIDLILVMLTALTAFFTLITGAFTVAITLWIFYMKKLASNRNKENKKILDMRDDLENKLIEVNEVLQSINSDKKNIKKITNDFNSLKNDYFKIRNQLYHQIGNEFQQNDLFHNFLFAKNKFESAREFISSPPTASELQHQLSNLLEQIKGLQAQLSKSKGNKTPNE